VIAAVLIVGWVAGAAPPAPMDYGAEARAAYLQRAIDALVHADPQTVVDLRAHLDLKQRSSCSSAYRRLRVSCLLDAARRWCTRQAQPAWREGCLLYSDILVTNKLSEAKLVPAAKRYRIMQRFPDYRRELRRELYRRYALLAVELDASGAVPCGRSDPACLASGIDTYCTASAEHHDLSWHQCAGALSWFVGSAMAQLEP
jgi:hypothetical protein